MNIEKEINDIKSLLESFPELGRLVAADKNFVAALKSVNTINDINRKQQKEINDIKAEMAQMKNQVAQAMGIANALKHIGTGPTS